MTERINSQEPTVEAVSVDKAIERYKNEWVLMKVTEFGEYHEPLTGIVLAHSLDDESSVTESLARVLSPVTDPDSKYYIFHASPRFQSWNEFQASVHQLDDRWTLGGLTGR